MDIETKRNDFIELAVIIPVYNEEEVISTVLREWHSTLDKLKINFEIHAYNDGSNDNSLIIMNKISDNLDRLIVHDKENSGHGPTILKGYCENLDAEFIFQVDSDNEMSHEDFFKIWEYREKADFILGQRDGRVSNLSRKIISWVSRVSACILYSNKVHDVNTPYRLMRSKIFKKYWQNIPEDTLAPNIIISGIAGIINCRIAELPIKQVNRATGEVSIQNFELYKIAIKSLIQTVKCRYLFNR
jgi:dolichol-phosphate mannosyltransferase